MDGDASFGRWIQRRRQALHLTQAALAGKVYCSTETIRKIEADARRPSPAIAERLALHLALPLDQRAIFLKVACADLSVDRLALLTQIDDHPSVRSLSGSFRTLPVPSTLLIGRESELAELGALLENPACRLITIVGPGGIGKTRLALAAASEQANVFTHNAAFVPLQPISAAALVAPAILSALDITLQGQRDPRDQLLDYLRGKELLLVLDNFEQLLAPDLREDESSAVLLMDMLQRAPGVTLLVTSRERLTLPGEWLFDLTGLNYPPVESVNGIEGYSAVRLFVQRAGQVRRQFALADGEARAVARICRLVEGLPLAIELAAAALRTRSCTTIAAAIESNLSPLAIELRGVPERHRSIWATFEHSWRLLSDEERQVFPRLSVFRGGFEEAAAVQVAQATSELLAALVDKSLLRWDGAARYNMHELLRQYAGAKLEEAGEVERLQQQHAMHYLAVMKANQSQLWGPQQSAWLDQLEQEHDNVRVALVWTRERGDTDTGVQLAAALAPFWELRGYWREGRMWAESLLAKSKGVMTSAPVIELCRQASNLARRQGDYSYAMVLGEEGLALCHKLGDRLSIAVALRNLGNIAWHQEEHTRSMTLYEKSLLISRELDDRLGMADSLRNLGRLAYEQGDDKRATMLLEEGLMLCRGVDSRIDIARALLEMGDFMHNDHVRATALLEESLSLFREFDDKEGIADSLRYLGQVAHEHGDYQYAAARYTESLAVYDELGDKHGMAMAFLSQGEIARLQGDYSRAEFPFNQSLSLNQELGNKWGIATTLHNLGHVALHQDDVTRATVHFTESLQLFRELKDKWWVAASLAGLAGVAGAREQPERAARLFGAAEILLGALTILHPEDRAVYERNLAIVRTQLDEATFTAAWAAGRAMTLEQAIAYALEVGASDTAEPLRAASSTQ